MSEYTPDIETAREQYTREQPPYIGTVSEKRAEFDRFIAQVRRDAARDALIRMSEEAAEIAATRSGTSAQMWRSRAEWAMKVRDIEYPKETP